MNVRRATRSETPAVARTLARAFEEDPAYIAMFPRDRLAGSTRLLERLLEVVYFPHDDVWVTDDLRAVACWAPPGHWQVSLGQTLRLLHLATVLRSRSIVALRMLSGIENKHPKTQHHYLAFLGVDPEAQGRGLGAAVMRPVMDRGGEQYLETTNPKNHGFYRRQGFTPMDTVQLPAGVTATLMTRSS